MSFLMSDILTTIRDLASMELEDLGSDVTTQNSAIFRLTTISLREMAKEANNVEWSDSLNIVTDGYQTFVKDAVTITDMFLPMMVWNVSGSREVQTPKRTSFDLGKGWYRESDNLRIHTWGLTGNHKVQYIRYPSAIVTSSDVVELPLASQRDLIMRVVSQIKLVKNFYQESEYIKQLSNDMATIKASMAAMSKLPAQPSINDKGV